MTERFKVIEAIEGSPMKTLEIQIPSKVLEGLPISASGELDLEVLMQLCHRLIRLKRLRLSSENP